MTEESPIENDLANKQDIAEVKLDITGLKRDIKELELRLKHDLTIHIVMIKKK